MEGTSCVSQPHTACSVLGREPKSKACLGKPHQWQSSLATGTLPDRGSEQS